MKVYIVFHLLNEGRDGYSICHLCCTEKQAEAACEAHPPVGDGWTVGWKPYALYGFPYWQAIVGLLAVVFLAARAVHVL